MNSKYLVLGISGVLIVVAAGWYLISMQSATIQPKTATTVTESLTNTPTATDAGRQSSPVKEVMMESQGLKFTLTEIKAKKGETIRVTYKNNVGSHDWRLEGYNVGTELLTAGQKETVTFVVDQAGKFEYYCSVPGHRQAGMKGMLIVE